MKKKWGALEKQQKTLLQTLKNIKGSGEFFTNMPETGYMFDNISKKTVKLTDCKSSTLRRYTKLLNKYYYLVTTPADRKIIADKQSEVTAELNTRDDA